MTVVWLRRAVTEHGALVNYIASGSPRAAIEQGDRVIAAVRSLVDNPHRGRSGRVPGTRELVVGQTPYIVVYRLSRADRIEILRVLHGAQRWPPA